MNEVLYTTEDLSKMFRVGKSTIKRWTDEGKLQCFKTPGGHRKFKTANVREFVTHYHYEVSSPVLNFVKESTEPKSFIFARNGQTPAEDCFTDAIKGRRYPIEQAFSSLYAMGIPLAAIFDQLLTPVIRMVHTKFQHQLISSMEFQIAKNTLTHSIIHFTDLIPKSDKRETELYCLSVNEGLTEVDLKAVERLLENIGMTVYNLGNVLTKFAAVDIVSQCKPEDVFVVLSLDHSSDDIIGQFNALTAGVQAYGGNVYTSNFFEEQQPAQSSPTNSKQLHSFAEIVERVTELEKA